MIVCESDIRIDFPDAFSVLKFDGTDYYTRIFNNQPGCKGVDVLAASDKRFMFIEVKNSWGNEANDRWRIGINNTKRDNVPTQHDVSDRDSLDIETAKKVAMTISALVGSFTRPKPSAMSDECIPLAKELLDPKIHDGSREVWVILLLEGDFANGLQTRTNEMIYKGIRESLEKKLKWLKCTVLVANTAMIADAGLTFSAKRI